MLILPDIWQEFPVKSLLLGKNLPIITHDFLISAGI